MNFKVCLLLTSFLVSMLFAFGPAYAAVKTVCSSGCDSTTVQGGINAASDGDEVRITDSREYPENVTVNRSVTLTSTSTTKPQIVSVARQPPIDITSNNVTVRNLTIKYNGTSSIVGTVTASNRLNITIANNTITNTGSSSSGGYGVYFTGTTSSRIENNTINTAVGGDNYGIYLASSSNSNTLTRNTITTSGTSSGNDGIRLSASSSNTLTQNTITTSSGTSSGNMGIRLSASSSNTLTQNTISASGTSSNYGIYLFSASSSNTLTQNTISASGTSSNNYGIGIDPSSNSNTFRSNNVTTNTTSSYGIYIDTANNNTFYDSKINATQAADVFLVGTATGNNNYFVNVTFNKTDIGVNGATVQTRLFNQYRLDVTVNDSVNPLNGAAVYGNDTASRPNIENPTSNFSTTTNSSGQIPTQILSEFMSNGTYNIGSYLYFNNYTINASKSGYNNASTTLNITSSTFVTITILDITSPTITFQSPTNTTTNTPSVWANVTLNEAGSTVLRSLDGGANVSLTNSSGNWNNLMTNIPNGPHSVKFYANDSSSNEAASVTVFFTILVTETAITSLSPNPSWWNDTVSVTGVGAALESVTARVDGATACTTTASASGNWNCSFLSPQKIGTYNLSVAVGATADDVKLTVRPTYGQSPTGTVSRFVLEVPHAIQEPSGAIRALIARLTISRGPPT